MVEVKHNEYTAVVNRVQDLRANRVKIEEMLVEDLKKLGFLRSFSGDNRYWVHPDANVQVFFNTQVAARMIIYKDFKDIGSISQFENIKDYNDYGNAHIVRLELIDNESADTPELTTSFLINLVEKELGIE